jgi:PAS domain S-box-containing protein
MYSFEWDVATGLVMRSPEHAKILGVSEPLHFTHQQFVDKIHPDDRPRFTATITGLTAENPVAEVTYRALVDEGVLVWLKSNGRAFFDGEGRMLRVIGMVADVTDQKLAEEALSGMTRKLVDAQEQERARIARELHDDIIQRLVILAIEIERIGKGCSETPSQVPDRAHELSERTKEILSDIQALSHELHSSKLEYLGIVGGMRSWCNEFAERREMEIEFKSSGLLSVLTPEISLCLLRVLQEALHNAARHSGVKRIDVQLQEESGEIHLVVSDSGKGFDVASAMQGRGLGVTSMQERVRLVGGTIVIDSKPTAGTTIHVRVPFSTELPQN